jgi:DNA-binding NtrC family response regulator
MSQRQSTILLVEDDPLVRDLILDVLAGAGYATNVVYHHSAVRGALSEAPADLILSDSGGVWPGDVWEALDEVRVVAGATPVLIVSGHTPTRFAGYAERGFAGVVTKPFDVVAFLDAVRAAIGEMP